MGIVFTQALQLLTFVVFNAVQHGVDLPSARRFFISAAIEFIANAESIELKHMLVNIVTYFGLRQLLTFHTTLLCLAQLASASEMT